ncbi:hypothetical protein CC1G_09764 [Coprinopsis cinerea okayama7|uniref:Uncharacterized protein n=1 Tax=Coprinopsis cinerea (strain Okayama-7 / 130 / ATCC MYA-4618 / FGSC 9003) TaxID=240176 RepID=A8PE28_COPC7|nr:hypothetical protein CC1G_09764 [Coprinopsis cinerea okayama7\|eukprot:XP_001840713.2 hypothetical protein CC1G_09764 [Coprinopsis cinerea okayama7\
MPSMPRQTIFLTPSNYKKTSIIPIGTARSGLCSIYFSPDGHYLAGATGRKIIVWQLQSDRGVNDNCKERWTRHVVYSLEPHDTSIITCMVWALDHSIVIGTSTGNLYFIQLSSSGTTLEGFQVSNHPIKFIALNSNSQLMAVVAGKREVGIWEFSATKDSWQGCIYLRSPEDSVGASREVLVTSVSWCNSEVPLLVVSYFHHGVLTWNLADLGVVSIVKTDVIATLSPDGQMMSIPNAKGTFDLYDLELKEKVATLYDPDEPVSRNSKPEARPGRFMYGGSWFIGGNGTSLRLWDVSSHLPAQRLCLVESR